MATSQLQRKFSKALSIHYGQHIIRENSRPEWCLGDDFERLELDFYLPDLNVAVEIQGGQHYVFVPHFHGTYEGFLAQRGRDEAKKRRCVDYGIELIEVDDGISFDDAIARIRAIERAWRIRQNHGITPEQWGIKLRALNDSLTELWRYRMRHPRPYLAGKMGAYKGKLQHIIDVYSVDVFRHIDCEIAQSIFWHAQKIGFWIRKPVRE